MTEITFKTPIKKNNESPFPHPNTDSKFLQNKVSKTKRFSQPEGKEKKNNWVLESPFCRLLNDSETQPPEKYQVLGNKSISTIKEKEIEKFKTFFGHFNNRNPEMAQLFHEKTSFEVIGEEVYGIEKTLNCLAQNFKTMLIEDRGDEIVIDEMKEEDEELLVLSGRGYAESFQGKTVEFIISCKFTEEKIKETRMKFIWT